MLEWYVAKVKTRNERNVQVYLGHRGTEVYSPEIMVTKRGIHCTEALFPGYVFIRTDPLSDGWPLVRWAQGVCYFLPAETHPVPVADSLVEAVGNRVARWNGGGWSASLQLGDHVVVESGPLRSLDAIFQRHMPGRQRCEVLIILLGRSQSVKVDIVDLHSPDARRRFGVLDSGTNPTMATALY